MELRFRDALKVAGYLFLGSVAADCSKDIKKETLWDEPISLGQTTITSFENERKGDYVSYNISNNGTLIIMMDYGREGLLSTRYFRGQNEVEDYVLQVVGSDTLKYGWNEFVDRDGVHSIDGNPFDKKKVSASRKIIRHHFEPMRKQAVLEVRKTLEQRIWNGNWVKEGDKLVLKRE